MRGGPSVSGKPCPRLTAPCSTASAVISAKIVVPKPRIRATRSAGTVWDGTAVVHVPGNGLRAAVVQLRAGTDKTDNLARLCGLVRRAAEAGAELVVAPEAAMHDFGPPELPQIGRAHV